MSLFILFSVFQLIIELLYMIDYAKINTFLLCTTVQFIFFD